MNRTDNVGTCQWCDLSASFLVRFIAPYVIYLYAVHNTIIQSVCLYAVRNTTKQSVSISVNQCLSYILFFTTILLTDNAALYMMYR